MKLPRLAADRLRLDRRRVAVGLGDRLTLGILLGVLRTAPSKALVAASTAWVELFRNIRCWCRCFSGSSWCRNCCPRMGALGQAGHAGQGIHHRTICLGLFTSSRVAEQVRAGIQALPHGQVMAGLAMGLTLPRPIVMCCCHRRCAWWCRR